MPSFYTLSRLLLHFFFFLFPFLRLSSLLLMEQICFNWLGRFECASQAKTDRRLETTTTLNSLSLSFVPTRIYVRGNGETVLPLFGLGIGTLYANDCQSFMVCGGSSSRTTHQSRHYPKKRTYTQTYSTHVDKVYNHVESNQ